MDNDCACLPVTAAPAGPGSPAPPRTGVPGRWYGRPLPTWHPPLGGVATGGGRECGFGRLGLAPVAWVLWIQALGPIACFGERTGGRAVALESAWPPLEQLEQRPVRCRCGVTRAMMGPGQRVYLGVGGTTLPLLAGRTPWGDEGLFPPLLVLCTAVAPRGLWAGGPGRQGGCPQRREAEP